MAELESIRNSINSLHMQMQFIQTRCQNVLWEIENVKEKLRPRPDEIDGTKKIPLHLSKKLPLFLLVECANYKIQTHSEFSGSEMAAEYAYKWISTSYPSMNPQIIRDAILIRPYAEHLRSNDETTRAVVPGMKVARWKGTNKPLSSNWTKKHDPIWECLTFVPTYNTARIGVLHTVLLVTTEEGHRICLDLSIGQFQEEELRDILLYYNGKIC